MKRFYDLKKKRTANILPLFFIWIYLLKQKIGCVKSHPKNIMKVDVLFDFAKAYDTSKFDIALGQKFSLIGDSEVPIRWFSDQDPVLSLRVIDNNNVDGEATEIGSTLIFITNMDLGSVKQIQVNVVFAIVKPATSLGLTSDSPISKI